MAHLCLSFLGSFHVTIEGEPVEHFRSDKIRALLAYLVLEADRPHRRETLAGLLWPELSDQAARDNLRLALLRLRRTLGEDDAAAAQPFLLISANTIQFNRQCHCSLDVAAFQDLLAACEAHAHRQAEACSSCARRLTQAVELYRGPLLEGFFLDSQPFEEWLLVRREMLHAHMVSALYGLAAFHERRGGYADAERYTRWQLALEPWREEAHCQLMRILAASGQRSAALAQYETCRRLLAEELGAEPCDDSQDLYWKIESGVAVGPAALNASKSMAAHLPLVPTLFVGREAELAQIGDRLDDVHCRLLTIVGPGGIGKTRLALQSAAVQAQAGAFAQGVYFIPVDAIPSPALLVSTIAEALGFSFARQDPPPLQQLVEYLREKEILLILDSLEHLLHHEMQAETVQLVRDLLEGARRLTLLVTSRQWLNLHSETLLRLDGLPEGEAIALFDERARRVQPSFTLSEETRPLVAHICRLLQGMPLAIELAAAWARVLPGEEIARQLEQDLSLLETAQEDIPDRQRSLWATFDRSWDLLAAEERQAFCRLGVFRGRFSLEAASAVAGADLAWLSLLLDRSLVRFHPNGDYELHNLLAQYAAEKLGRMGTAFEAVSDRHCAYYAAFLQRRVACLQGACLEASGPASQVESLGEIGRQLDQLRAAWRWAAQHRQAEPLGQMIGGLFYFYDMRSFFREGADMFAMAVTALADLPGEQAEIWRAQALARQGWFVFHLGQPALAVARMQQALAVARRREYIPEIIFCLNYLGAIARHRGEYAEARSCLQYALALAVGNGDHFNETIALNVLGQVEYMEHNYAEARRLCRQGLMLKRAIGDRWGMLFSLTYLGLVAYALEEYAEARGYFEESLEISRSIGDRRGMANSLMNLGDVAAAGQDLAAARLSYQKSLALFREIGTRQSVADCLLRLDRLAAG